MELDRILTRFSRLTGLTGEALEGQRFFCADTMAQLSARRNEKPLGDEGASLLEAACAAVAAHRHLLAAIAAGGSLTVGDARVGEGGPVAAAAVLEAQCLAAADPWLRPGLIFRRMEG